MKKYFLLLVLIVFVLACTVTNENKSLNSEFSTEGKKVAIYTTASETDLRLAFTGNKIFKDAAQPQESEVSVFVNPNKTFQTFLGIGGAITDASAEVFAKLPGENRLNF